MKLFKICFFAFNILCVAVMFCPPIQDKSKIVVPPYKNEEVYKKNFDEILSLSGKYVVYHNGQRLTGELADDISRPAVQAVPQVAPVVAASVSIAKAQANNVNNK